LYERHKNCIYNYCLKFSQNKNDAEDLTQDTFVNVFNSLENFQFRNAKIKTWIYKIAFHNFINFYRKKNKSPVFVELNESYSFADLKDELEKQERKEIVRNELKNLKPNHREILEMEYFQGLKYKEIWEKLNLPEGTAKARITYAKKRLENLIELKYGNSIKYSY